MDYCFFYISLIGIYIKKYTMQGGVVKKKRGVVKKKLGGGVIFFLGGGEGRWSV